METLVVAQHRNQYYSRSRRFGSFGSPPSGDLRGLNCRGFQSDVGILPSSLKACNTSEKAKSPSSALNSHSDDNKHMKRATRSSSIPIPINFTSPSNDNKHMKRSIRSSSISIPTSITSPSGDNKHMKRATRSSSIPIPSNNKEGHLFDEFPYSELWAGPAYSNSPPPSSVPIPKFSLQTRHTVSLDLPSATSCIDLHPIFKSAPASPTRALDPSPGNLFCNADSATKYLRRVLHLDLTED